MKSENIKFEILQMAPEFSNSILVSNGDQCIIFDAWGHADHWEKLLADRQLRPIGIYSTHGHFDHIAAAPELAQKFDIPWHLNHRDLFMIANMNSILSQFGLPEIPNNYQNPIDLPAGEFELLPNLWTHIILCPGHSPGGVAFHFAREKILIIGDTLFQDTIGRYDLPGANRDDLFTSIACIYNMNLPDDTTVIHGHGEPTNIGWLKKNNRYFSN